MLFDLLLSNPRSKIIATAKTIPNTMYVHNVVLMLKIIHKDRLCDVQMENVQMCKLAAVFSFSPELIDESENKYQNDREADIYHLPCASLFRNFFRV